MFRFDFDSFAGILVIGPVYFATASCIFSFACLFWFVTILISCLRGDDRVFKLRLVRRGDTRLCNHPADRLLEAGEANLPGPRSNLVIFDQISLHDALLISRVV